MIASIFSHNGNQMVFAVILMSTMFMPFLGVLIARIPLKGMGWVPHLKGKLRYVFLALWMPAVLSSLGGVDVYKRQAGGMYTMLTAGKSRL